MKIGYEQNKKKTGGITETDGKIYDLSSKSLPELCELRDRQKKLADNKYFLSKLSDKGEKINLFYNKIIQEIQHKLEEDKACQLLNNMKLNSEEDSNRLIHNFEWKSKSDNVDLDSDDESEPEEVLKILSQTTAQTRVTKIIKPIRPLITEKDITEINDVPHIKYIVDKTENNNQPSTKQFKPYKTTMSDVHNPEKEINRKKHKNWEVTAATPPSIIHGPTKILSLEESLNLLQKQSLHLKEVEAKHAAVRLMNRLDIKMATLPKDTSRLGSYREQVSDASEDSDDEISEEVHDDEPERGGVVYSVMN